MSETSKKVSLDAVLGAWPDVEKSAADWEDIARSVDERVKAGQLDRSGPFVSDEDLLIQPLGQIEGEGHNSAARVTNVQTARKDVSKGISMTMRERTMQPDRERDRRSLQDLAKMATTGMTPPPPSSLTAPSVVPSSPHSVSSVSRPVEAKKDDSGIVDLAMAAQSDPQAALRAQTTPLASGGLFDDEPASVRPGPVSGFAPASASALQQPAPSILPFSLPPPVSSRPSGAASVPSVAPSFVPAPTSASSIEGGAHAVVQAPEKKKGGVVFLFGGLIAVAAVAAGGFLFVRSQHAAPTAQPVAVATQAPAPVVAADTKPADTVAANPTPSSPAEMDPNALPSSPDPAKAAAVAATPAKASGPTSVAAAPKPAAAPANDMAAKLSQKDMPSAPVGPGGDLGAAMKGAVGGDSSKPVPAAADTNPAFAAGSVPQKPSQGAVTGAIGAVLPSARACLGPDDAVSRAAITFTSNGSVQNVNVTGGAAGKPAADCIKSALMKAKLQPFAEPTYSANITVRH